MFVPYLSKPFVSHGCFAFEKAICAVVSTCVTRIWSCDTFDKFVPPSVEVHKFGRLQELAESGSGYCHAKRVCNDKFHAIKKPLNDFYVEYENAPMGERVSINHSML